MQKNADVNEQEATTKVHALWNAVVRKGGDPKLVEALLERGAKVDLEGPDGRTALCVAVNMNYPKPDIVRMLLDAGANTRLADKHKKSAYDYCMKDAGKSNNAVDWANCIEQVVAAEKPKDPSSGEEKQKFRLAFEGIEYGNTAYFVRCNQLRRDPRCPPELVDALESFIVSAQPQSRSI